MMTDVQGQASTSTSSPVAAPPAVAGPSTYKNPFFREPPRRIVVNPREDFHPWKHAQVPHASSIRESACLRCIIERLLKDKHRNGHILVGSTWSVSRYLCIKADSLMKTEPVHTERHRN